MKGLLFDKIKYNIKNNKLTGMEKEFIDKLNKNGIKLLDNGCENAIFSINANSLLKSKKKQKDLIIAYPFKQEIPYSAEKQAIKIFLSLFMRNTKYYSDSVMSKIEADNSSHFDNNEQVKEDVRRMFFSMPDHYQTSHTKPLKNVILDAKSKKNIFIDLNDNIMCNIGDNTNTAEKLLTKMDCYFASLKQGNGLQIDLQTNGIIGDKFDVNYVNELLKILTINPGLITISVYKQLIKTFPEEDAIKNTYMILKKYATLCDSMCNHWITGNSNSVFMSASLNVENMNYFIPSTYLNIKNRFTNNYVPFDESADLNFVKNAINVFLKQEATISKKIDKIKNEKIREERNKKYKKILEENDYLINKIDSKYADVVLSFDKQDCFVKNDLMPKIKNKIETIDIQMKLPKNKMNKKIFTQLKEEKKEYEKLLKVFDEIDNNKTSKKKQKAIKPKNNLNCIRKKQQIKM